MPPRDCLAIPCPRCAAPTGEPCAGSYHCRARLRAAGLPRRSGGGRTHAQKAARDARAALVAAAAAVAGADVGVYTTSAHPGCVGLSGPRAEVVAACARMLAAGWVPVGGARGKLYWRAKA